MSKSCKTCVTWCKKSRTCPYKPGTIQAWELCREHEEKK